MAQRQPARLYRSRDEKMIAGVAGGLAEYFDVDPVLMRLLFVVGTILSGGVGILLYLVLWIVVPKEGEVAATRSAVWRENTEELVGEARRLGRDVRGAVHTHPTSTVEQPASDSGETVVRTVDPEVEPPPPPETPEPIDRPATFIPVQRREVTDRRQTWAGIVLLALGAWLLAQNLNLLWWVRGDLFWPLVLLGLGAWLLLRQRREHQS